MGVAAVNLCGDKLQWSHRLAWLPGMVACSCLVTQVPTPGISSVQGILNVMPLPGAFNTHGQGAEQDEEQHMIDNEQVANLDE